MTSSRCKEDESTVEREDILMKQMIIEPWANWETLTGSKMFAHVQTEISHEQCTVMQKYKRTRTTILKVLSHNATKNFVS
jgi:hypothetical protein